MAMTAAPTTLGTTAAGPHSGAFRPPAMGVRGVVSSAHGLASQAGVRAMMLGGNAVDAAVAVAATLAVVEPFMSGLGGDGFYHVYRKATGEAVVFNGTGSAPRAATPERYASGIPMSGPLAFSTPGTVGAWGAMHARYGRRSWPSLFESAVYYAREGFGATPTYRNYAGEAAKVLNADTRSAQTFLRDGQAPALGTAITQRVGFLLTFENVISESTATSEPLLAIQSLPVMPPSRNPCST